ncbi:EF-hand domain-containing protein [Robiginitomaculum antarcticum]|uniref:EF-hand domain-containing protein n=1 Tax=Robiginitomaculum antarcticum TaxID=437507 RepID=UPI00037880B9|nr:EF-hand domain-containing protein [Robiginitomaculum antarcticum]
MTIHYTKPARTGLLGLAALTLFAAPALAGDPQAEAAPTQLDYFNAADTSGDAALDAAEFQTYIETMADGGDISAQNVRDTDDYTGAFLAADTNANGSVSFDEVTAPAAIMTEPDAEPEIELMPQVDIPEDSDMPFEESAETPED